MDHQLENQVQLVLERVLSNENGDRLEVFSKSIGMADSNTVEFLAILEAFKIFVSSRWKRKYGLILESDSLNAARWFNNFELLLWRLKILCPFIETLKSEFCN
ncbi:hypothetical protein REPUB_Repub01dG0047900 [Reevesia pubescens]